MANLSRRRLCEKIGVDLEGKGTAVIDHVDHVTEASGHSTVLADNYTNSSAILGGLNDKVDCLSWQNSVIYTHLTS